MKRNYSGFLFSVLTNGQVWKKSYDFFNSITDLRKTRAIAFQEKPNATQIYFLRITIFQKNLYKAKHYHSKRSFMWRWLKVLFYVETKHKEFLNRFYPKISKQILPKVTNNGFKIVNKYSKEANNPFREIIFQNFELKKKFLANIDALEK